MELTGKVNISKEEILAKFSGEELVEYVKKNYPTKAKEMIVEPPKKTYSTNQWFKGLMGYYFLVRHSNSVYHFVRFNSDGSTTRMSDNVVTAVDGMISETEFEKYYEKLIPVDFKSIPLGELMPWLKG